MIDQFILERRPRWEQLELLLRLSHSRRRSLSADDLDLLGRLYRQVTSDLAIARRDYPGDRVTRYLEQLVGRAHPVIYRREASGWSALRAYATHGFPRAFREAGGYTAAAFALLAVPFLIVFIGTLLDPAVGRTVLPLSPVVEGIEQGQSWLEIERAERGLMSSAIMTNNIQVTFFAFAGGVFFGLGTVFAMVNNGLHLGAVAGLATVNGLGGELASFVSPHGGIELTVIFIAGGAGLRLGHALLAPGLLTRRMALAQAARQAMRLLLGGIPLLMIAGLFEGFVSPSGLPNIVKYLVGAINLILLYAYLLLAGRPAQRTPGETAL